MACKRCVEGVERKSHEGGWNGGERGVSEEAEDPTEWQTGDLFQDRC